MATINEQEGQKARLHREKRKQRVADAEAARPEAERYLNRTDFDDFVVKQLSISRQDALRRMKLFFFEFALDENIMLVESEDEESRFFQPGGRPFTTTIIRKFLEYAADARTGQSIPGSNGKVHYNTLIDNLTTLSTLATRSQNPIERAVLRSGNDWLDGRLVPEGRVNTVSRQKKWASEQDVSQILATLFTIEHMATFVHTRYILYVSLFINLAVDCAGRVSELLVLGGKLCNGKCLRWCDIEVFAFLLPDGMVTLKASVRYADLKGSNGTDVQKVKVIPLRLMPLYLAAEDSLRQLVTIGIIDDVFEAVKSWQDIQYLVPGRHGSRVKIKETALQLPVFRRVHHHSHVLTNYGFQKQAMTKALGHIGRRMGLTTTLMSYCLRRGAAYLLAANCTEDERCARMGHHPRDNVYWLHYRNETSTVDFQAIRTGVDAENLSVMSSMLLGSREGAPMSISTQGFRDVYKNPKLKALLSKEADLLDSLLTRHPSLDAAKANDPRQHKRLQDISAEIVSLKVKIRTQIYRAEYEAYMKKPCEIARPGGDEMTTIPTMVACLPDGSKAHADNVQVTKPWGKDARGCEKVFLQNPNLTGTLLDQDDGTAGTFGVESATSAVGPGSSEVSDEYGDLFKNIDPTLLEDDATQNIDRFFAGVAAEEVDIDEDNADSPVGERRKSQMGQCKTLIAPWTIADDVPAMMFGLGSQSENELGAFMVDFFNHVHPIDYFFPGQEPLTGTLTCRFCRQPMTLLKAPSHARACAKDAITKATQWDLETKFPILEQCSWLSHSNRRCRRGQFLSHKEAGVHVVNHWTYEKDQTGRRSFTCRLSPCHEDVNPGVFRAHIAWYQHLITVHGIPASSLNSYIRWCGLCGRWLSQVHEDLDDHNAQHEQLIGEIIRTEGFTGVVLRGMAIRPPLNPFEVYDTSLQPSARYDLSYSSHHGVGAELGRRIAKFDDNGRFVCPASVDAGEFIKAVCSRQASMSKDQLCSHMAEAHGIRPRDHNKEAKEKKEAKDKAKDSNANADANGAKKNKNAPEASDVDEGAQGRKRIKSRKCIGSLQPESVNAAVGASMKSNALRP